MFSLQGFQCSARQPLSAAVMAAPSLTQQRRLCACGASRKNRKGGGGGGKRGGCSEVNSSASDPASEAHRLQDAIRESRQQQLVAADMLAKLLQAEDPQEVAQQYTDSLDEQFFWQANTFLSMAKKEGNAEVVARLEAALKAAFEAKQATLRPEIQLLNRLLAAETAEQRQQVLGAPEAAATLAMNDRYFFQLLGRMAQDVGRQPEGDQRATLLAKLEGIQADAQQRAAGAEAEAAA
ncbi:hypothetical protein CHLNCDRAFT_49925 [Chlorella variabilis]|uniref:Uncharacterized protein n=1 Tax=Chlorella variabilis TaxID=554065 RepID=E1Z4N4_CHLVA|nr:hypothetical protein CHLNCDRAFT_49925 [Chlorella variabilis]EFN59086.1 hypothetical protein CHLNCDRAFT_49925 [Chlorella variabilis]|eukprot:XP_005851188.1 hypothetical protein CHLNCDRAFT_49925 [Chlorella variabilis]